MEKSKEKQVMKAILKIVIGCLLIVTTFFVATTTSYAATYTVTKTADTSDGTCDADCSFREAVVAANSNAGADMINFNIPTSDGGYLPESGSTQSYWTITINSILSLTDDAGVTINGYSQAGAQRNTAAFGETINTVLKIRLFFNDDTYQLGFDFIPSNNNHLTGLNIVKKRFSSSSRFDLNSASNNFIEGNFFGSDITGSTTNGGSALRFLNGSNSNIVGTNGDGIGDVGERNLFAGSEGDSGVIMLWPVGANSNTNIFAGNYFGTTASGRVCSGATIYRNIFNIDATTGTRIGTNYDGVSDAEEANILGCVNTTYRATLRFFSGGNIVQGNYIGISPQGDTLGSLFGTGVPHIELASGTVTGNVIKGNILANGAYGITCRNTCAQNTFSRNSIFNNEFLGISLASSTPLANDSGDVDIGANNLMNYPVLQSACIPNNTNMYFIADLDFQSSEGPFTIEFFANDEVDSSGYGEGKTYLGSTTTLHVGSNMPLTITLQTTAPTSPASITATVTNASGSTSEFSAALGDLSYDTSCVSSPTILPQTYSQPAASFCADYAPVGKPDLFQILRIKNTAVVFFTPVLNSTRSYLVMYGFKEGEERYGASLDSLTAESNLGVQKLAISDLDANQEYWFKVAPKNGCAVGEWSNWMKAPRWQGKPELHYK